MSVLTSYGYLTIAEAAKRAGYDSGILGELQQNLDYLDEVPWFPATHGTYNKQLQASRLGTGSFAKANSPITIISSTAEEVTEPVKLYEGDSVVDERILRSADDVTAVRDSEDYLNLSGLMQDWMFQLFYGSDVTSPDNLRSFSQRRAALATNRTWGFGGTGSAYPNGDLTDLWLFEFGKNAMYMAYNKGGSPGLKNEDRGRHLVTAPTGTGQMWGWMRHYEMWAAIVIRDDRALQRGTNIETAGSSNIFDPAIFIKMKNQLPSFGKNAVAFVNRTLKSQIDNNAYAKTNLWFTLDQVQGFGPVTRIAGVPVRLHEGIPDTLGTMS